MAEKVKLTKEQANAVDFLLGSLKGMRFTELFKAIQYGYEIKPEYKVGDWIFDKFGRTSMIERIAQDGTYLGENFRIMHAQTERHATPEEIKSEKERRLWKSIEREVGSFKIGDCYSYGGSQMGITTDRILETAEIRHKMGKVEGFYPAESFISFEVKSND